MERKNAKKESELYRRIDEVMQYILDSIGISGCPSARDEYYSYVPEIFELAKRKNKEQIVELLNYNQTDRMILGLIILHCNEIADIILYWSSILGVISK